MRSHFSRGLNWTALVLALIAGGIGFYIGSHHAGYDTSFDWLSAIRGGVGFFVIAFLLVEIPFRVLAWMVRTAMSPYRPMTPTEKTRSRQVLFTGICVALSREFSWHVVAGFTICWFCMEVALTTWQRRRARYHSLPASADPS
jgi:hypothetical protein